MSFLNVLQERRGPLQGGCLIRLRVAERDQEIQLIAANADSAPTVKTQSNPAEKQKQCRRSWAAPVLGAALRRDGPAHGPEATARFKSLDQGRGQTPEPGSKSVCVLFLGRLLFTQQLLPCSPCAKELTHS